MKEKIYYLDGLRGVAAFIVVIHHYILGYYPTYASSQPIATTPLNILYNGNTAVCIFFVLSGYVLSNKFFKTKDNNVLIEGTTKRYFRLLLPVFASIFVAYLFLATGLFTNQEVGQLTNSYWLSHFYTFDANFFEMLKQGLYRVFLYGESSYNINLWTIYLEFLGSLLVFSFLAFFGKMKKRYIVYILLFFVFYQTYYLAFLLGVLLCDLKHLENGQKYFIKNKVALFALFALAIFFASYPYGPPIENTVYEKINFAFLNVTFYQFYHIIGGFLLVYVLLASNVMQKFFSYRPMIFLGKISFSLYVFHLVIICSFSASLFEMLLPYFSYKMSFIIMFLCSLVLLLPLSYLSYKYIDLSSVKLGNKVYSYLVTTKPVKKENTNQLSNQKKGSIGTIGTFTQK